MMGRHIELVTHKIPNTTNVILKGKVKQIIAQLLKNYTGIVEIHIQQGEAVIVRCLENVWTSGL